MGFRCKKFFVRACLKIQLDLPIGIGLKWFCCKKSEFFTKQVKTFTIRKDNHSHHLKNDT